MLKVYIMLPSISQPPRPIHRTTQRSSQVTAFWNLSKTWSIAEPVAQAATMGTTITSLSTNWAATLEVQISTSSRRCNPREDNSTITRHQIRTRMRAFEFPQKAPTPWTRTSLLSPNNPILWRITSFRRKSIRVLPLPVWSLTHSRVRGQEAMCRWGTYCLRTSWFRVKPRTISSQGADKWPQAIQRQTLMTSRLARERSLRRLWLLETLSSLPSWALRIIWNFPRGGLPG